MTATRYDVAVTLDAKVFERCERALDTSKLADEKRLLAAAVVGAGTAAGSDGSTAVMFVSNPLLSGGKRAKAAGDVADGLPDQVRPRIPPPPTRWVWRGEPRRQLAGGVGRLPHGLRAAGGDGGCAA